MLNVLVDIIKMEMKIVKYAELDIIQKKEIPSVLNVKLDISQQKKEQLHAQLVQD